MHGILWNESDVTILDNLLFIPDPLLNLAIDHVNNFFLVGMLVKIVSLTGCKCHLNYYQVLAAGIFWSAALRIRRSSATLYTRPDRRFSTRNPRERM